jgi:hypothetical protein
MIVFGGQGNGDRNDLWQLSLDDSLWRPLVASGTPPSPRYYQGAIYDPRGRRMVVFGGRNEGPIAMNDTWALTLDDHPAWIRLATSGTPPSPRFGHTAIYDPVGDRMIVFGGYAEMPTNDLWALSLRKDPHWTELAPIGTPPSARVFHSAVYQPWHHRMIVFGGLAGRYSNDVWILSIKKELKWSPVIPLGTSPPVRAYHAAALDVVLQDDDAVSPSPSATRPDERIPDRLVIFGGWAGAARNDSWILTIGGDAEPAWTKLDPGVPPKGRRGMSAVLDPIRHRLIVFGGYPGIVNLVNNEVLALNLGDVPSWTAVAPSPRAFDGATLIHDPLRRRLILFGGEVHDDVRVGIPTLNEVWSYSLDEQRWVSMNTGGFIPPLSGATAIYDPVRDRMIVHGGRPNGYPQNAVYELSLGGLPVWHRLDPNGSGPARQFHSAIYDPVQDRMLIYGGTNESDRTTGDVWALSLSNDPTWTLVLPVDAVSGPGDSNGHSAVYDPARNTMVVTCLPGCEDWELPLTGPPAWHKVPGAMAPCSGYTRAAYDPFGNLLVVFGGLFGVSHPTLARTLGTPTAQWSEWVAPVGHPGAAYDHAMTFDSNGHRVILYDNEFELWALDTSTPPAVTDQHPSPGAAIDVPGTSAQASLSVPSPHPSRGSASFDLVLPVAGHVRGGVYDLAGRRVATLVDGPMQAGLGRLRWEGHDETGLRARSGMYFCRVDVNGTTLRRAFVFLEN